MSEIKQAAFLQGYLDKEATSKDQVPQAQPYKPQPLKPLKRPGFMDRLKEGWSPVTSPMQTAKDIGGAALDTVKEKGTDYLTGTTQQERDQMMRQYRNMPKTIANLKRQAGQALFGLGATNLLGQVGTAMYQNAAANRRHQQMMQMMKKMYGQRQAATPPQAFRLSGGRGNQ